MFTCKIPKMAVAARTPDVMAFYLRLFDVNVPIRRSETNYNL